MSEKHVFLVRSSSFFSKKKLLTLTDDAISIGTTDNPLDNFYFKKEEVDAYRYKARRARFYFIRMYTYYMIDIRSVNNKMIKIRSMSIFGIRNKQHIQKFQDILNLSFAYYFNDIAAHYLNLFHSGIDFELADVIFTQRGIQLKKTSNIIEWSDVGVRDYLGYYALFSKKDPHNYKACDYWDEWNTNIIYGVSKNILKSKSLQE